VLPSTSTPAVVLPESVVPLRLTVPPSTSTPTSPLLMVPSVMSKTAALPVSDTPVSLPSMLVPVGAVKLASSMARPVALLVTPASESKLAVAPSAIITPVSLPEMLTVETSTEAPSPCTRMPVPPLVSEEPVISTSAPPVTEMPVMALLIVALAALFGKRNRHPFLFFTLLALLANVNAHGFIIAGFLAVYHLWHLWLDRSQIEPKCLCRHGIGAFVLGLTAVVVVILVWPPADLHVPGMRTKFWNAGLVLATFTPYRYLSVVVLVASALWFARRKTLLLWAGPMLALLWLFIFKCGSPWHQGVVYYYWVFCAWISWEAETSPHAASETPPRPRELRGVAATLTLVVAVHVYWGAVASYHDVLRPYSGSREAYAYLAEHDLDERAIHAYGFSTVSVLPYFSRNIFDNHNGRENRSYFVWAKGNPVMTRCPSVCDGAPEYVLVGVKYKRDHGLSCPEYELVRRFEGRLFWKASVLERDSLYLYRRRPQRVAAN